MGRYAEISKNNQLALSGLFAEATCEVIGREKGCDSIVELSYHEVHDIMLQLIKDLNARQIHPNNINYQYVKESTIGYLKLESLMLWLHSHNYRQNLTFC